tara:strand:+ start:309 stop:542 length:234 start_codon:yes stop_codon:yes gene_type:complete
MSDYTYSKELVYDPNGNLLNMGGQKTWRVGYFVENLEPTGREIPTTDHGNWEGDDYEEEYKRTYRKEISKKEYDENK